VKLSTTLPDEFVAYHRRGASMFGVVSAVSIGWFQLWPLSEIYFINCEYQVAEYVPGLVGIGSANLADLLAFNQSWEIVVVPFSCMQPQRIRLVANSWRTFEKSLSLQCDQVS
jgi:hypothetical protein